MTGLDTPQLVFFVILGAAFLLLLTERLRNDVVALLLVLALSVSELLEPDKALSGFGSEPAIVVAAIFVLSAALHRTGASDALGRALAWLAGAGLARVLVVIMPSLALLSAFYVFIAGAIPLGAAMKSSGAAETLAGWLQGAVADWSETAVLLALFAVVAVVTQFMSDSATTRCSRRWRWRWPTCWATRPSRTWSRWRWRR